MSTTKNTPAIYVGTFAKYNNGNLSGQWVNLTDFTDVDEFIDYCNELHADEIDPEFMFQDYEYIPQKMIADSYLDPEIFEAIEKIDPVKNPDAWEQFIKWCACTGYTDPDKFLESLYGHFDSLEDFGADVFGQFGYEVPEYLHYYIDYEKYGRDLILGGDFFDIDDYYYLNC